MTQTKLPSLQDKYLELSGTVDLTGIQALARLPMDIRRADIARGRSSAVYVSGYEGSPLGGYDLELIRQRKLLDELDIVFQPGVNEELAATAVQGTQLASARPEKRVDGVVGIWYGKSPGLDRASDALRHANLGGTHPQGGAIALVGDDPAAKSSTVPGSSEVLLADLGLPILYPADPAGALHLGLHAVEMSRASGLWVAMKIATNVADASGPVPLAGPDFRPFHPETAVDGLPYTHDVSAHLLQPALTPLEESRNGIRLDIARWYAADNDLNVVHRHATDRIGVIAGGKTYLDLQQALHSLGLDAAERARRGVRLLELRMIHPLDPDQVREFAEGLDEIIVVEEKRSFVEAATKSLLYGRADAPRITGKTQPGGRPAFSASGELDPDSIAGVLASRLLDHGGFPTVETWQQARRPRTSLRLLPLAARTPYFCSGCPHNTSVRVPDGALVGGGIGCHGLALGMAPELVGEVTGLTQMGGEGAQWLGMAPFLERDHLFQNLGDGTFHHSGSLAIRAAVAGGVNITYKLLYNSAVAMTGGQQAQGAMSIPKITRSMHAEGVARIIVTTDEPRAFRRSGLAPGVTVWTRDRLVEAQEVLAATPGVTLLIHDQECATELRRKRKRGLAADPVERVVINERICEGCGDCGSKSNCLSVHPVDTEFGRKTRIDQSSCNKDYSCLDGDCPAFITVVPGTARPRRAPAPLQPADLPEPTTRLSSGRPHTTRILGIGGSGVVTLSQILGTAARLAGLTVATLDQTGLAQKGGAVVSDIKIGHEPGSVAPKAASGEVDLYLGADLLVAADPRNLVSIDRTRTRVVVSTTKIPTGRMATDVGTTYPDVRTLTDDLARAGRTGDAVFVDARSMSHALFGDDQFANMFLAGIAFQLGELPIPSVSVEQAITLNNVRVEENIQAFRRGRQYVADGDALAGVLPAATTRDLPIPEHAQRLVASLDLPAGSRVEGLVRNRTAELAAYQSEKYAEEYLRVVARTWSTEQAVVRGSSALTESVAHHLHKLMAYKDEYEVARLALLPDVAAAVEQEFGAGATYRVRLHPPILRALGMKRKLSLGPWFRVVFRLLVALRFLRGTRLDPFGYARVRKVERRLAREYVALVDVVRTGLRPDNVEDAIAITDAPDVVRGYEHVKLANVEKYEARIRELVAAYDGRPEGASR